MTDLPTKAEFLTGMRRRRIVRATQLNPDLGHEHTNLTYEMPLGRLGSTGLGPKTAYVPHPKGMYGGTPGRARLFYEWAAKPRPYQMASVNTQATALLLKSGVVHVGRSRALGPEQMVLGYAWLVHDEGSMSPYFTLRAEHEDAVTDYIYEHHTDDFTVYRVGAKLNVFPAWDDPAQYLSMMEGVEGGEFNVADVIEQVREYASFPVYARMMWG